MIWFTWPHSFPGAAYSTALMANHSAMSLVWCQWTNSFELGDFTFQVKLRFLSAKWSWIKGTPIFVHVLYIWALPFFLFFFFFFLGGGLNACLDGFGHLFREELSKFKWAFPCFWGGLNACPDGLGHLLREELSKFKRASACFGGIVIQYHLKFPLPPIVAGLSPSNLKDREVQHKKQQWYRMGKFG